MKIGGLIKTSLVDYPGKVSAVIFTQGCNMRCPYCHNPELVYPNLLLEPYDEKEVMAFLEKRKGNLDGVVITGGEPAVHYDLIDFIAKIKGMGYAVKLDTNGTFPEVLEQAINLKLVDCIAMDLKAPFAKYNTVAGVEVEQEKIAKSMAIIAASGVEYEFRTTYDKTLLNDADIKEIENTMANGKLTVQECLPVPEVKDALDIIK